MDNGFIKRALNKMGRELAGHTGKKAGFLPQQKKIVSFTFDDFPVTAIENGARLLEEHNARGTFYASLGLAGTIRSVGKIATQRDMLALSERGHECGCHTFGHINCADSSPRVVLEDCLRNQDVAKKTANLRFRSFAYPWGYFTRSSKRVISSLYENARTAEPGINVGEIDLAALKSVELFDSKGSENLRRWLAKLNESGGWLIFFSHDVGESPSQFGCSIRLLVRMLEESISYKFCISTILEAASVAVESKRPA